MPSDYQLLTVQLYTAISYCR